MTRITFVGLVMFGLVGCVAQSGGGTGGDGSGDGSGSGSGNGNGSGSGSGGGTIAPRLGVWHYDEIAPVSSTCSSNIRHGEAGDFGIDLASTTTFHVLPNDGTDPFTCTLSSGAFDCPNRLVETDDARPGADVVITIHAVVSGLFSDLSHATGRQDATVTCSGTQCSAFGTLPCTYTQDFAIRAL